MTWTIVIDGSQMQAIEAHASSESPRECCGVLLGRRDDSRTCVEEVVVARNIAGDPVHGYEVDPRTLVAAHRRARQRGVDVVGYYHSHPGGHPVPSQRDRVMAWPEASYLIVSVEGDSAARCRSWRIGASGELEEERLEVTSRKNDAVAGSGEVPG